MRSTPTWPAAIAARPTAFHASALSGEDSTEPNDSEGGGASSATPPAAASAATAVRYTALTRAGSMLSSCAASAPCSTALSESQKVKTCAWPAASYRARRVATSTVICTSSADRAVAQDSSRKLTCAKSGRDKERNEIDLWFQTSTDSRVLVQAVAGSEHRSEARNVRIYL